MKRRPFYDVLFYLPSVTPVLAGSGRRPGGGAETQIVLLARALARRGLSVCLVAYPSVEPLPRSIDGVDIVVRPAHKAHQRLVGKLREVARIGRTVARVRSRVVVVRVAGPQVGLVALSARLLRRRYVYSSANIFDFRFEATGLRRRDLALYRLGLRLAHEIVVQTDEQRELCKRVLRRDAVVIRSVGEPAEPHGEPEALLWIGRLVTYKHPLAFVELARSLPDVPCRLLGITTPESGSVPEEVRSAAAGVANLQLIEPAPRGDVLRLIDRAVAIVNTSDYEGMPNIFLEGWARGVPALTLSHDPDHVIARFGLGHAAGGDLDSFVEAARTLWQSRAATGELSARCRAYMAEQHGEEAVAAAWARALGVGAAAASALVPRSAA